MSNCYSTSPNLYQKSGVSHPKSPDCAFLTYTKKEIPHLKSPVASSYTKIQNYSHSMVPGGLLVMSYTTLLTPGTSLAMRFEIRASTS